MSSTQTEAPITHLLKENAAVLTAEMQWLARVIDTRIKLYWDNESEYPGIYNVHPPKLKEYPSFYAQFVTENQLSVDERIILLLALAPDILPQLLDVFFIRNNTYDRGFTEFGGIKGQNHAGFIPTAETAAFILSAGEMEKRFHVIGLLSSESFLVKNGVIKLTNPNNEEPFLSSILTISAEYLSHFTRGVTHGPDFTSQFPAKQLHTEMSWDDLVLDMHTLESIEEILTWTRHGEVLMHDWGMKKTLKPGFRTLFYGPPGTGKTLTASLLGKATGMQVYRIDLSMMISKYIGETEKNLANVFSQAENKNWILFFDEADALFGKRTLASSANDRYANQEVSYLLQRIEDYPGVVILATNLKANMDEAFSRRFQSMVHFPMPGPGQRLHLWEQAFPEKVKLDDDVDFFAIANKYELSGGAIINIVRHALLKAVKRGHHIIKQDDLMSGIRKELAKDGKTV